MRIVIDMQGAQAASRSTDANCSVLSLIQALVRHRGEHDIILALSGLRPESIEPIRAAFDGLLLQDRIRVWHALEPVGGAEPAATYAVNTWRRETAELIRETFLASLSPDVVYISGVFGADGQDSVISVGLVNPELVTVVALTRLRSSDSEMTTPEEHAANASELDHLKRAHQLVALPPLTIDKVCQSLGVDPEHVKLGWAAAPESSSEQPTEAIAKHLLKLFEELAPVTSQTVQTPQQPQSRPRPKLAYVSPLPPERSGISGYSAELLPELSQFYDIDVIVNQAEVSTPWIIDNCGIQTHEWFVENAHAYSRVLYHFGNSPLHQHMFDLLDQIPGVVVLHDFYLGNAQLYREVHGFSHCGWTRELYHSHGYLAVAERFQQSSSADAVGTYPTNLSVVQRAQGVIVHSEHSRQLAGHWYGKDLAANWRLIPLLRMPSTNADRIQARAALGLKADDFIVCSFGLLGPTKLNHRLLEAWLHSHLAHDARCLLVFVGENSNWEYATQVTEAIRASGLGQRIHITGWADTPKFRNYLAAADLAVQLRTLSRGETSAAVLDCMNQALPTIVNANGSMADLPNDSVCMLPDVFENSQLIEALETLWQNGDSRVALGQRAKDHVTTQHSPQACAGQYAEAIEHFTSRAQIGARGVQALVKAVAELEGYSPTDADCLQLASSIARSLPVKTPIRQFLVDVSATCRNDLKTGIQRVVRALVRTLIKNPPPGYRVEPVYLTDEGGTWHYRYARKWTSNILDISDNWMLDEPVAYAPADVVLIADFTGGYAVAGESSGLFQQLKNDGITLQFVVYDLLPIQMPEAFPPNQFGFTAWLRAVTQVADGLICISQAVAEELHVWLKASGPKHLRPVKLGWFHLGADIESSSPSYGVPKTAALTLTRLAAIPSFLMVGTIEPRKGYLQALEAFTLLWKQGVNVNLIIVGKEGWNGMSDDVRRTIPEIVKRLRSHPELNRRLIWLEGISDEYLEKIYAASTCLIAASQGEGFGLPLIEAAQHALPIIARDIPVFREVAREYAYYFNGEQAENLSTAIKEWIELDAKGDSPDVKILGWLTWEQSAEQLKQVIFKRHWQKQWVTETRRKILYVDISHLVQKDLKTGIQRVTRSIVTALMNNPPADYQVKPVFATATSHGYLHANRYAQQLAGVLGEKQEDEPIDPQPGDIFLGLDFVVGVVVAQQQYLKRMHNRGVRMYFVVYDLLPTKLPQCFPEGTEAWHRQWLQTIAKFDGAICISRAVKDDLDAWLRTSGSQRHRPFDTGWFHLGADVENSLPTKGIPKVAGEFINKLAALPSFLMVGTVEPRKGHTQTLQAFELLWDQGAQINLVIVGNQGWMVEELSKRLHKHPELNNRLFWLQEISDEYLEQIYAVSTCLIAASEGEGFGLPLIEAAKHKLPIIARDIPEFREVAGDHADYFSGLAPASLASAVEHWLAVYANNGVPKSEGMPWITWSQSADQLLEYILLNLTNCQSNAYLNHSRNSLC